ncbi:MAG TPA: serine protease [Bacteroidales bacterium]|nr:serine protease [Bacteroidales bacterium]HRZ49836.1 serine protease [Bacteroidales bacterium]
MEMKGWTEEDFDHYYMGLMEAEERSRFEADLARSGELKARYEAFAGILRNLQKTYTRKSLRKKLQTIHAEMASSRELTEMLGQRYRLYIRRSLAVAASAALMVTLAGLYFSGNLGHHKDNAYLELRNEVQGISSEQEYIRKELTKGQRQVPFTGSSFVVSSNGILATNVHVIRNLDSVWVTNFQDTLVRYKARIIYKNETTDIALLKIDDPGFSGFGKLPYAKPARSGDIAEYVFTLGYSKQEIVFGEGSISSVSGYYNDTTSYQVSIPVNPGNSGGPLFDAHGNFLGLISGKNTQKEGVGFAVKSDYIYQAIIEASEQEGVEEPVLQFRNRLMGKSRTEQVKVLQPLVFKVEIPR